MRKRADYREEQCPEDCHPKPLNFESLNYPTQDPEEEAVDNKSENTQGQDIKWQGEQDKNRLDSNVDQPPQERQDERRPKARDRDTRDQL